MNKFCTKVQTNQVDKRNLDMGHRYHRSNKDSFPYSWLRTSWQGKLREKKQKFSHEYILGSVFLDVPAVWICCYKNHMQWSHVQKLLCFEHYAIGRCLSAQKRTLS